MVQRVSGLETQLEQLRAQVRQAQQLAALGTAAATIAHEVSNLMTPILGYARAALDADDNELARKALRITVKNAEMLTAMSNRLLAVGAAKQGKPERVGVASVVADAIDSLCRDLSKDGTRLKLEIDEDICVWADRLQLHQVLFNLFLNAREAMIRHHSGTLTVRSRRRGESVLVEVVNGGEPIPADQLPRVFEPLQSGKTNFADAKARCRGLGLALCRDLIEENGGTIAVSSAPDVGTQFTITLPENETRVA